VSEPSWNQRIIEEFRASGGKKAGPFGEGLMLITHRGAKSGQERTTPVVYSRDGDRYVIVASKAGAPENPSWYYNLLAHPIVTVEVGSEKFQARVTEVKGPQRAALYAAHAKRYPNFNEYQQKTTRTIPVLELERRPSSSP
jgi:deazaflavin-dependent oxidoreductase (nitroreductase family)